MDNLKYTDDAVINQDRKIWNNGFDYYIQESNFDPTIKTNLSPGTELAVYDRLTQVTKSFWFADDIGTWIKYKNQN